MDYEDLKIAFKPGEDESSYLVEASSGTSSVPGTMQLQIDARDLELLAAKVTRRVRGGRRGPGSSALNRAEEVGRQLFSSLFTEQIGGRYRLCVQEARQRGRGVRISLSMRASPRLIHLPWELLYDPEKEDFLSLSTETPVVRHIDLPYPQEPLTVNGPLRILGMVSSPDSDEYASLETEKEISNLEQAVKPLVEAGLIEIHWLENATYHELQRALRKNPFQIFHFIGHGGFDGRTEGSYLVFEDRGQGATPIPGDKLGVLLGDHPSLRLVVLNSCEGARGSSEDPFAGVAASLMKRSIPAVIAMQFEITDSAAILFSSWFYETLAEGEPVDSALAEARKAIFGEGENEVEWATPVLFTRVGNGRVFAIESDEDEQARESRRERLVNSEQEAVEVAATPASTSSTPVPAPATGAQAENFIRRGEASLLRRHNERALEEFHRALEIAPDSVAALQGRGEAHRRLHRLAEAESDFDHALGLNSDACGALVGRARVRIELEQLEEAREDVARALEVDPGLAEALATRGLIELHAEPPRRDEALADFAQALQVDPTLTEAITGGAIALYEEDLEKALELLQSALENDPRSVEALVARGLVRAHGGDEGALADLDQAISIDPHSSEALLIRGIVRMRRGDNQGALVDFGQVIAQLPPRWTAYLQSGWAYLNLEDPAAALAAFDNALALRPGVPASLAGRGTARLRLERYDEALADFEQALEGISPAEPLVPLLGQALLGRGLAKLRLGQPLEAVEDIGAALARGVEETAPILLSRMEAHLALGNIGAALDDQLRANELDPGSAEVQSGRGMILATVGLEVARETRAARATMERKHRNHELLASSQLENDWYADQRTKMIEHLNGLEELIWLCRCRRPQDSLRQTVLLITSQKLLWCRRPLLASNETGELLWSEVDHVSGEGENLILASGGFTRTFVISGNKGTDLRWKELQLDAGEVRSLVAGLVAGWQA